MRSLKAPCLYFFVICGSKHKPSRPCLQVGYYGDESGQATDGYPGYGYDEYSYYDDQEFHPDHYEDGHSHDHGHVHGESCNHGHDHDHHGHSHSDL
eukprot:3786484-Pyramimonas_sp.AAC.2